MARGSASADGLTTKSDKTSGKTASGTKDSRPKLRRETPTSPEGVDNDKLNDLFVGKDENDETKEAKEPGCHGC